MLGIQLEKIHWYHHDYDGCHDASYGRDLILVELALGLASQSSEHFWHFSDVGLVKPKLLCERKRENTYNPQIHITPKTLCNHRLWAFGYHYHQHSASRNSHASFPFCQIMNWALISIPLGVQVDSLLVNCPNVHADSEQDCCIIWWVWFASPPPTHTHLKKKKKTTADEHRVWLRSCIEESWTICWACF